MDGRRSLSTVTEGCEPDGQRSGQPLCPAPSPNRATPHARQSDEADDATLASALTTALQPEQMEILLRRLLRQGQVRDAAAPATSASFAPAAGTVSTPLPAVIMPLQTRFPAIDPVHFRDILENRFRPENIIKLSTTFFQTSRRQEMITLGSHSIPTGERDRESSDYRFFPGLTQPWNIYTQILLHFCPHGIYRDLVAAFFGLP
jgi:hypothetical protein